MRRAQKLKSICISSKEISRRGAEDVEPGINLRCSLRTLRLCVIENVKEELVAQEQFLNVINRDEAEMRFRAALNLKPLGVEQVALHDALGRVLASDVVARVDVPSFDRSNLDG